MEKRSHAALCTPPLCMGLPEKIPMKKTSSRELAPKWGHLSWMTLNNCLAVLEAHTLGLTLLLFLLYLCLATPKSSYWVNVV